MALYRRALSSAFSLQRQCSSFSATKSIESFFLGGSENTVPKDVTRFFSSSQATTVSEPQRTGSASNSEVSNREQSQHNNAEELSVSLNEMAVDLEQQRVDGENNAFPEQREALLEEVQELAAKVPPRQAPLPEDFVPPPEPSTSQEKHPQQAAPPKPKPQQAPVSFPSFTPATDKSRPAKPTLSLDEALRYIKSNAKAKFDETVEATIKLGVNPKRGDQMVRGAASLPFGSGKPVRVAVFASGTAAEEARQAGADVVGADDLVEEIKKSGGKLEFDRCIATPAMMPLLGQVARILGPRGLMPNPKTGTITNDVGEAVRATKRGRVNFRADKFGIVHVGLGKVSFEERALKDNLGAFAAALLDAKPTGAKGAPGRYAGYLVSLSMSSTMGAGVKVDVKNVGAMAEALRAHQTG